MHCRRVAIGVELQRLPQPARRALKRGSHRRHPAMQLRAQQPRHTVGASGRTAVRGAAVRLGARRGARDHLLEPLVAQQLRQLDERCDQRLPLDAQRLCQRLEETARLEAARHGQQLLVDRTRRVGGHVRQVARVHKVVRERSDHAGRAAQIAHGVHAPARVVAHVPGALHAAVEPRRAGVRPRLEEVAREEVGERRAAVVVVVLVPERAAPAAAREQFVVAAVRADPLLLSRGHPQPGRGEVRVDVCFRARAGRADVEPLHVGGSVAEHHVLAQPGRSTLEVARHVEIGLQRATVSTHVVPRGEVDWPPAGTPHRLERLADRRPPLLRLLRRPVRHVHPVCLVHALVR
mmetsp:Transcript_47044/g.155923  ORF Transcript_47044/g.155923 Transcript_47044/m.155923 type:complete len:349 (+) Transcript_47044:177-1223(+)